MTFYDKINKIEKDKEEIIQNLRESEFMKNLKSFAPLDEYDLFSQLVGIELRSTHAHGPIFLKGVSIPKCYNDKKDIKKKMIRLVLNVKYWAEDEFDIENENQKKELYDVWLDIPSSLLESWSMKKMKKWCQEQTNFNRSSLIKSLEEENEINKQRLNELKNM